MFNSSKSERRKTYYEDLREKGHSRRDFMKFCTMIGAYMGLQASGVAQVTEALQTKPRLPVIWLHFQECTGCSESFIRSSHPIVADIILDKLSLDYSETLMAAAGHQAEAAMKKTMKDYHGEYVLCVEGSVSSFGDGEYCMIGGKASKDVLKEAAEGAKAILAWGSCASHGNIQAANPNPTDATPIHEIVKNKPIIKVPGCPPIGEAMAGILTHILTFDRLPELDHLGRPKAFYSKRIHDSCYRRPYYDAGLFVESFDDPNAQKGYCLYKMGCKGPTTYAPCAIMKWNGGVSFPIQSGHGCFGCSEENYWDNGPIYERVGKANGFGIEANADTIGKVGLGATAAGIAAHAVATNLRKYKMVEDLIQEGKDSEEKLDDE